jgi:hypothetical protein
MAENNLVHRQVRTSVITLILMISNRIVTKLKSNWWVAEVVKVNLKNNANEALSNDFL